MRIRCRQPCHNDFFAYIPHFMTGRMNSRSMDARLIRPAALAALLIVSMGASYRGVNFVVTTADPQMAVRISQTAEQFRHDLALEWLGQTLPDWAQPCNMTVQVAPNLGAGGATTFVFDQGEVYGWKMTIQGSAQRVLDSVLPHEITHMIFASYFRRPLPRWADEGGATSVEHVSEKQKHRQMLVQFLRTGRGIAFGQMFAMTEYPPDVMPLYAQGYSLAEYLIYHGGRRKFVAFLAEGMNDNQWSAAVARNYGIRDLTVLQNSWVSWVAQGFPAPRPKAPRRPSPPSAPAKTPLAVTPVAAIEAAHDAHDSLIYHVNDKGRSQRRPARKPRLGPLRPRSQPRTGRRVLRPRAFRYKGGGRPAIRRLRRRPARQDRQRRPKPPDRRPAIPGQVILEWQQGK